MQRADVEPKYEAIYNVLARFIDKVIARTDLPPAETYSRLKTGCYALWAALVSSDDFGQPTASDLQARMADRLAQRVRWTQLSANCCGSVEERETSLSAVYTHTIRKYVPAACDLVIDLGCGWGHRMIDLYLSGLNARYVGGDRSNHSRTAVLKTAALFPEMKCSWFPFDFLNPDFTTLPDARHICMFTCHAVEQVQFVGAQVFDRLLVRYPDVELVGVHIEPISFQLDPTREAEKKYTDQHRYNQDLYDVVKAHPRLAITDTITSVATHEDWIWASLLAWKRAA